MLPVVVVAVVTEQTIVLCYESSWNCKSVTSYILPCKASNCRLPVIGGQSQFGVLRFRKSCGVSHHDDITLNVAYCL